jgi:hypothetical protein
MTRRIFAKSAIAACVASILRPVLDVNGPWERLSRFNSALVIVAVITASFGIGYGAAALTAPPAVACVAANW